MEGKAGAVAGKDFENQVEQAKAARLKHRLEELLREAASVEVELSRADGTIQGVPHYSVIEGRAHELGKQLSRQVQQQQMNELAAAHTTTAICPACNTRCQLTTGKRLMKTVDGDTELQELKAYCPSCRRSFFPSS